ncbi:N-acylneuraminate cytidylyltransferase [Brevundimonas sp. NIBR10]|uniref:acylneuraminate cytidylyltransferase family protein n=1 Tax=Brevundimonas sp. NIBR10 TaxID=3015997 RepID=UPI0022F1DB89|nr:acylneuraminate cytidylyltransferase family protein [Brevundimonas sp. NIBR10]WGM46456.1 N-acylneuraminate cytidylyltransferase [Brevundimonas sp. NIBR10]
MIDGKRVLAIVPARAGSERLPGKNVRPMAGRPMVEWTLRAGLEAVTIDRLVVSTDDPAVAGFARAMEIGVIDRPDYLAGSTASVIDAVDHALETVGGVWDYVVLLQPTSPLRTAADIDGAVTMCEARGGPAVIGVSPMSKPPGFYGRVDEAGTYHKAEASADEPVVINGAVYVGRPERLRIDRSFQTEGTLAWVMPAEQGWDVDTLFDFTMAEALMTNREPSSPSSFEA